VEFAYDNVCAGDGTLLYSARLVGTYEGSCLSGAVSLNHGAVTGTIVGGAAAVLTNYGNAQTSVQVGPFCYGTGIPTVGASIDL
jgi:hypothetical protein